MNELARMENMSSEETTDTSELTFRTAVLKVHSFMSVWLS